MLAPFDLDHAADTILKAGAANLWGSLGRFACTPPRGDKKLHKPAERRSWFEQIYALRPRSESGPEIELSFTHIRHATTGHAFPAFCLNKQLYIGHDPGVMVLAHERIGEADRNDRIAGICLYNFPPPDQAFTEKRDSLFENMDSSNFRNIEPAQFASSNVFAVIHKIERDLQNPLFHGGDKNLAIANTIDRQSHFHRVRISRDWSFAAHRDSGKTLVTDIIPSWYRVFTRPIENGGTVYSIGTNEDIDVECAPGTAAGHIGCTHGKSVEEKDFWGAWHKAPGNSGARAVLLMQSRPVDASGKPSSWQIETLCAAGPK